MLRCCNLVDVIFVQKKWIFADQNVCVMSLKKTMSRKRLGSLEECVYCKKYKHYKSIKRHEKTCPKNTDNSELERLRR